jgi:heme/copper-type cytochrome/quinol oxidase subunit 4
MSASKKPKENAFLVKVVSFSLEILLYTVVFLVLESASLEQAMKAAIVLAIGIRFFFHIIKGSK